MLLQHVSLTPTLLKFLPYKVPMPFWLGVEIFFVISGYVIVTSLARDRFEPLSFFCKRVFRLSPAILVFIGLCAAVNAVLAAMPISPDMNKLFVLPWADFRRQSVATLFGYITFKSQVGYSYGAMWSLAVEDQFYAALAVTCLTLAVVARRHAARVAPAAVFGLAFALYAAILYLRADTLFSGHQLERLPARWKYLVTWKFDFLALGILMAFADRWFRDRVRAFAEARGQFLAPILLLAPLGFTALSGDPFKHEKHLVGLGLPVAGLCFGLLVLIAAHNRAFPPARGWLYRLGTYLGDRSYTIYLLHFPMMAVAWGIIFRSFPEWGFSSATRFGFLQVGLMLGVMLPIVELIYRGVEQPLTRLGRRLSKRLRINPPEEDAAAPDVLPMPTRKAA